MLDKQCSLCRRTKAVSEFSPRNDRPGGRQSACRECVRRRERDRRLADVGKARTRDAKKRYGNPTALRKAKLKYLYGITLQAYEDMFAAQGGLCLICKRPEQRRDRKGRLCRLCVDHDHKTGKIRGLLCRTCNYGIGAFEDDPQRLVAAAAYVLAHRKGQE